ncbi:MAG: hypothetical protein A2V96_02545 [Candidatus Yonathbacteria bacterium RBG_16_43_6]|uniref:DUF805 domain-containing protein n=1 Tax=Candidatus Yonathbacteria bacterium RIFCSPLOWO2_01_FULL_43_27 TaxID=1802726 RepID=A0A1G2SCS1_9BACT|nr:MAG: hypothetical protein A2V96_02545 [Candidatus Yonathbacteria bacterium RBG_16_43_6]OHA82469.1 MAG: hypothetical protein A3B07_02495 [Candidatus Yonathbacteria bacterium RIFCSPLOWO2_01_FULL_43_27]
MDNYIEVLKKYALFNGRAGRKEYWMFTLVNVLIMLGFNFLSFALDSTFIQVLGIVYLLAVLVPSLAVYVRRLHDTNHSAWWILLGLIPIVGSIILLIFLVTDSQAGDNIYGTNPKGVPVPQIQASL